MPADSCPSHCYHAACFCQPSHSNSTHSVATLNTTTARAARANFAQSTVSSLFSNSNFTNHESLPSFRDAFSSFAEAFPQYLETQQADDIREREYSHLSDHVCLDYSGVGLFSHAQMNHLAAARQQSFLSISHKSASLKSEMQEGEQQKGFEAAVRKRIMSFLRVSGEEYCMVFTANRTAAFRILAEAYPFESNKTLLTVCDCGCEAVTAMVDSAQRRGAKVISASFTWPGLRIHSGKLEKFLSGPSKEKKRRGLFLFTQSSRMTGVRHPYLWMKLARDNGWHVVLDACTLGPKDMDTFGLTLIKPDFVICSFLKVFGENPSGFAGLFINKCSRELLETSTLATNIGLVSIVHSGRLSQEPSQEIDTTYEQGETTESVRVMLSTEEIEEEDEEEFHKEEKHERNTFSSGIDEQNEEEIVFKGLDHADSLGLLLMHTRLRCIVNWVVIALKKLQHPNSAKGHSLVKIYGPGVKFDRGPALAFNIFDWKGERVSPALVQKLADRSNISLSCGFLQSIFFSEKYGQVKAAVLEKRVDENNASCSKKVVPHNVKISVLNASFGCLANFEDAYRLWAFVAKFLDADFVEKERLRNTGHGETRIGRRVTHRYGWGTISGIQSILLILLLNIFT